MKTLRVVYAMARADFLERTRRYSFMVMLGLVLWIGYASASQQIRMRVPPDYLGVINSAWVGALMTITITLMLGWFGFYLIKGSVSRDYETGVGQIMATTPLTRPLYALGKWISNLSVLGVMILLLMGMGIVMNLWVGVEGFDLWALVAPLLLIALPCMALVAATAVLFEAIPWLRGGFGNIVYFVGFMMLLVLTSIARPGAGGVEMSAYRPLLDFAGWQLIGDSIGHAAHAAYPESQGGFAFSVTYLAEPKIFLWEGVDWTPGILLSRLFFLALAAGITLLAAAFFDRFNPSRPLRLKDRAAAAPGAIEPAAVVAAPAAPMRLTPLPASRPHFRFGALLIAELRLFLKGQHWWWYAIALGLIVAQLSTPLDTARLVLLAAWAWPVLMLSGMGCRENRHNTWQMIFAARRPVLYQLPAAWLAAWGMMALLGVGALVRLIGAGDSTGIAGWLTGTVFVPSLALVLGVWTGSGKAFEVIYVLWVYLLTQKVAALDWIGLTPSSPWYIYAPLALVLLALAAWRRWRQVRN